MRLRIFISRVIYVELDNVELDSMFSVFSRFYFVLQILYDRYLYNPYLSDRPTR